MYFSLTCLEPRKQSKHDLINEKLIFVLTQDDAIYVVVHPKIVACLR